MRISSRRSTPKMFAVRVTILSLAASSAAFEARGQAAGDEWVLSTVVNAIDRNCPEQTRSQTVTRRHPGQRLYNVAGTVRNASSAGCEGTSEAHGFARLRKYWVESQHDLIVNSPPNRCGAADTTTTATGICRIEWPGRAPNTPLPGPLSLRFKITGELRTTCVGGQAFASTYAFATLEFTPRTRGDGTSPPAIDFTPYYGAIGCPAVFDENYVEDVLIGEFPDNPPRSGDAWDYTMRFETYAEVDSVDDVSSGSATNTFGLPWVFFLRSIPGTRFAIEGGSSAGTQPYVDFGGPDDCADGMVNAEAGPVTDVLFLNNSSGGETRSLNLAIRQPITVGLRAAPLGPSTGATFWFWLWTAPPSNPVDLVVDGRQLGCTVNPTPFDNALAPRPFRCFHSNESVRPSVCGSVPRLNVPPSANFAPWTLTRAGGFARPITLTLQGVLEDFGAANDLNLSVTNALTLTIR